MGKDFLGLSDIPTGNVGVIVKVYGHGSFRNRIIEMGFVKGERVTVIKNAPLRDPIEYKVMDCHVALRRSEAELIEVVDVTDGQQTPTDIRDTHYNGTFLDEAVQGIIQEKKRTVNVALVGNPNCGKTSFFNRAANMREKVGNYGGVTVDAKKATFKYKEYTINLFDLPGTYSITEYTPEELYVRKHIAEDHPDVVLNVVDSTNLERNLYLTTQLIDMNIKVVMALNMYDELRTQGATLDEQYLGQLLGFPIVPTTASSGAGINDVLDKVIEVFEDKSELSRHIHINYGADIENAISKVKETIAVNKILTDKFAPRYLSIKTLESDEIINDILTTAPNYDEIEATTQKCVQDLSKAYKEDVRLVITNAKYGFIKGALKETFKEGEKDKRQLSNAIDTVLTHHWFGFPVLLFFVWVVFQSTFTLGNWPMKWIESGVAHLGTWISAVMAAGPLTDLLVDGVIAGVGGVLVFLPNILILFFFISLMEDTGYMARAAFLMDKMMHKIGLHGKSFIPLWIGFGCNVPAVMATRTLESRRDRLLTMLIVPFMSCSARLPVYVLLVSAFFVGNQGLVLFSIYLIGILSGIVTALLLKHICFPKVSTPFVMELPPYRMPTMRNTLTHVWEKGAQYIKKMGTIILLSSVLIWVLGYFPRDAVYTNVETGHVRQEQTQTRMENSYIGRIGKAIEPVIQPLGFDWKMGVSIVTGMAAKELVVSTMGVLYNENEGVGAGVDVGANAGTSVDASVDVGVGTNVNAGKNISEAEVSKLVFGIKQERNGAGQATFTPLVAYGFMLFVLLYFPCVAVIAAINKEAGWGWALFTVFYTTALAWLVAFCVYQVGRLLL